MEHAVLRQVVAPKSLSLKELQEFDGNDPAKPMYMAVKGTVFDVSKATQFYGPDGGYLMQQFWLACLTQVVHYHSRMKTSCWTCRNVPICWA